MLRVNDLFISIWSKVHIVTYPLMVVLDQNTDAAADVQAAEDMFIFIFKSVADQLNSVSREILKCIKMRTKSFEPDDIE